MIFRHFAEEALGSRTKVKILLYLLSENLPTSERELAKILGISHMAVNSAMKAFFDLNLVSPMRIGSMRVWKLNEGSYAYQALKGLASLVNAPPPLDQLKIETRGALGSLTGVKKAIIFGSAAEGKERPNSDIDLLVIVAKEEQKRMLRSAISDLTGHCLTFYGNPLSVHVLTEGESSSEKYKPLMREAEKGIVVI